MLLSTQTLHVTGIVTRLTQQILSNICPIFNFDKNIPWPNIISALIGHKRNFFSLLITLQLDFTVKKLYTILYNEI